VNTVLEQLHEYALGEEIIQVPPFRQGELRHVPTKQAKYIMKESSLVAAGVPRVLVPSENQHVILYVFENKFKTTMFCCVLSFPQRSNA